MNANLTLLRKGILLVATPLLLQVVFVALIVASQRKVGEAEARALHTKDVISKIEELYRRLIEGVAAIRGLAVTGDLARYARLERLLHEAPGTAAELSELVRDNPRQAARIASIVADLIALIAAQDELAALIRDGKATEARARLMEPARLGLLDGFRAKLDGFQKVEEALDRDRLRSLDATTSFLVAVMVAGGAISSVGSALLLAVFARGIGRRFAVLTDNARRMAEGQPLADPLPGRDEIAEVDRVFHAMARAIDEKNRENELFIYSVSHDLRSPLVNLQGFSQELSHSGRELAGLFRDGSVPEPIRRRGEAILDRDVAESIRFIQTAVSRLSVIIDALLRLSRAGRVDYRPQDVDVDLTVRRVVEALGSTIAERRATVTARPLPAAWADPTAIEQVFANLIGNAVNYLDPDRPGVVEVGAIAGDDPSNPRAPITYYVKDNGLGIPESGLSKMFMAFQRFHDRRAQGEGIGLALVRKIVERHAGRIWVESTRGVGSTFFVELPAPPRDGPSGTSSIRRDAGLA